MGQKVIFQDCDGVLNDQRWIASQEREDDELIVIPTRERWIRMLDPSKVARLNTLVEVSGAIVVLSSSWRVLNPVSDVEGFLRVAGFKHKIHSATPRLTYCRRGGEIDDWLKTFPGEVESFVILDDDSGMEPHMDRLVQTKYIAPEGEGGLQDVHVERALKVLSLPWSPSSC